MEVAMIDVVGLLLVVAILWMGVVSLSSMGGSAGVAARVLIWLMRGSWRIGAFCARWLWREAGEMLRDLHWLAGRR
jgi:hypothetical protein